MEITINDVFVSLLTLFLKERYPLDDPDEFNSFFNDAYKLYANGILRSFASHIMEEGVSREDVVEVLNRFGSQSNQPNLKVVR